MTSREIPDDMLRKTCRMGEREKCCRFILVDPDEGIICAKWDKHFGPVLRDKQDMTAKGDNCEGLQ